MNKFCIVVTVVLSFGLFAQEVNNDGRINLVCDQQPLRFVLNEIRIQSGDDFVYDDNIIDELKVTCNVSNESAENILGIVLKGFDISYKKFNQNVFVLFKKQRQEVAKSYTEILEQQPVFNIDTNEVIIKPIKISTNLPIYPTEASKQKIEGKVIVKLFIDENGDVSRSLVEKTSGSVILDSAALDYTLGLKFISAKANNKPIPIWLTIAFEYKIINKVNE